MHQLCKMICTEREMLPVLVPTQRGLTALAMAKTEDVRLMLSDGRRLKRVCYLYVSNASTEGEGTSQVCKRT